MPGPNNRLSAVHRPSMSTASSSNIESHLKETRVFKPSKEFAAKAHIRSMAQYKKLWTESVKNPERFWKSRPKPSWCG